MQRLCRVRMQMAVVGGADMQVSKMDEGGFAAHQCLLNGSFVRRIDRSGLFPSRDGFRMPFEFSGRQVRSGLRNIGAITSVIRTMTSSGSAEIHAEVGEKLGPRPRTRHLRTDAERTWSKAPADFHVVENQGSRFQVRDKGAMVLDVTGDPAGDAALPRGAFSPSR